MAASVELCHALNASRTVINGPFAEARELVASYWLWEVESMDAAIKWVKR